MPKVGISKRLIETSYTGDEISVTAVSSKLESATGMANARDCDVIFSCVDRPWPRHILNTLAYSHLIPVIDGGILARVDEVGKLLHVDWRIHTVGPGMMCLYCLDSLRRSDVGLDRDGLLDDPDYVKGLSRADREQYERRNVFAFSLSVASHEVLQLVGLVAGNDRIRGIGPQVYHAFPGEMKASGREKCKTGCDIAAFTSTAHQIIDTD
jgi:hypothetical protein